jgi:hypothetical protein
LRKRYFHHCADIRFGYRHVLQKLRIRLLLSPYKPFVDFGAGMPPADSPGMP